MRNFLLVFDSLFEGSGIESSAIIGLLTALVIVSIALAVATVAAFVLRIIILANYWVADRTKSVGGYTGGSAAERLIAELGYTDVQVRQAGFFKSMFFGNHYDPNTKTVWLRPSTYRRDNLTSVGLAVQKVAMAAQDKQDSTSLRSRWRLQKLAIFGPIFFIPLVAVGLIIDFATGFSGVPLLVFGLIALAYFVASFVLSVLNISVEKRANRDAMEMLEHTNILAPDEQERVRKVLNTYLLQYIVDFVINLLEIIRLLLKLLLRVFLVSSKRK